MSSKETRQASTPSPTADLSGKTTLSIVVGLLAAKAAFLATQIASMWIWGDEMLYYITAYDILHFGQPGIPHPDFMNYPPVTSLLVLPVHLLGLTGNQGYIASLIVMNVVQLVGALALYLLVRDLFEIRSRVLLIFLMIGSTTFTGLSLMSETPFIALYCWVLYFSLRVLRHGRLRDAAIVGLLIGLAILTRRVGIGLLGSVTIALLLDLWRPFRPVDSFKHRWLPHLTTLAVACGIAFPWKTFLSRVLEARYGYHGTGGYLRHGLVPALESLDSTLLLLRKFASNLGYISMSTLGICVPILLWYCLSRDRTGQEEPASRRLLRRLAAQIAFFALFAAFAAAVHMFINAPRSPNTRYLMYGRYVEYFTPALLALCFGIVMQRQSWMRRRWRQLAATVLVLAGLVAWVLPRAFFESLSGATSNMGIGWLTFLGNKSEWLAVSLGPLSALLLIVLLTRDKASFQRAGLALVCLISVFNLAICADWVREKSNRFEETWGPTSHFIEQNPAIFEAGLAMDTHALTRDAGRKNRLAAQKVLVDHLGRVRVARDAAEQFGDLPIVTVHESEDRPVRFQPPKLTVRILGPKIEARDSAVRNSAVRDSAVRDSAVRDSAVRDSATVGPKRLFLDDFETGNATRWGEEQP